MGNLWDLFLLCCGISPKSTSSDVTKWERIRAEAEAREQAEYEARQREAAAGGDASAEQAVAPPAASNGDADDAEPTDSKAQ